MNRNTVLLRKDIEGKYLTSVDVLRVICLTAIMIASLGLPIPFFDYLRPYLNAGTGILFTLYGFIVLRDGADLRKNIKHAAIVFAVLFAVYGLITMGYLWFYYGKPFMYFNKRGIFNFVVLNFWGENICSTIWYVQSTLYALIILWLLRRFKDYDWLLCIVLFVLAILIGELAKVINFSFLGNEYIPGNFLTRTIPYMLLGRLIWKHYDKLAGLGRSRLNELIAIGFVVSAIEYCALYYFDKLGYTNHLIGFIPVAVGACLKAAGAYSGEPGTFALCAGKMYKPMYYIFNPLYYVLLTLGLVLCRTVGQYSYLKLFGGLITVLLTFGGCFVYAWITVKAGKGTQSEAEAESEVKAPKARDAAEEPVEWALPERAKAPDEAQAPEKWELPDVPKAPERPKEPEKWAMPERAKAPDKPEPPEEWRMPEKAKAADKPEAPEKWRMSEKPKAPDKPQPPDEWKLPDDPDELTESKILAEWEDEFS